MDMFEQAFAAAAEVSSDENWTRLQKYEEKEYYSATDVEINLDERTIGDLSGNVSTLGEDNSQYIQFIMDRYADGVDLTTMLIQVQYRLEDGQESVSAPVNAYASESRIRFGWPISRIATQKEQTIQFIVFCTGNRQDGEPYVLKTKPIKHKIEFTLGTGGTIIAPDEDWFLQFENVMNEKMNQVAGLTEDAIDSAAGAKESEQNASQSASTASTLASQVQSNTAQAKASADAAKVSEQNAKASEDAARVYAGNASAVANVQIGTSDTAGLLRGGDIHVDESGALKIITETTETAMPNSCEGRLLFKEIRGKSEQKQYGGHNQFNLDLKIAKNGIDFDISGSEIKASGTPTSDYGSITNFTEIPFNMNVGKSYKIISNTTNLRINIWLYDEANNIVATILGNGESATVPNSTTRGTLYYDNAVVGKAIDETISVMLTTSDYVGDYEPYVGRQPSPSPSYPQEIKSVAISKIKTYGKNHVNTTLENVIHYQLYNNYEVVNNGLKSTGESCLVGFKAKLNSDKPLVLSYVIKLASDDVYCRIREYNKNPTDWVDGFIAQPYSQSHSTSGKFTYNYTPTQGTEWIVVGLYTNATGNAIEDIMLSENGGEYEPYKESVVTLSQPITLDGIGDVQDVIVDGKPIRRITQKRITSGMAIEQSPDWANKQAFLINDFFADGVQVYDAEFATVANIMCTHAPTSSAAEIAGGSVMNGVAQNLGDNVYFSFENCATLDAVKTFLDNNAVYVYYELATPITTLPTADQVALNSLKTFDGTTYLEFDSPLQPEFVAEYGTSKVGGYTLEALAIARNADLKVTAAQAVEE